MNDKKYIQQEQKKAKNPFAVAEEEVLALWDKEEIFKKSVEQRKDAPVYSFYDGPPFASGLPHYGHILASVIKDTVTRYWSMRGYKVERRVGWDCHGLPVENLIEKELGLKSKKDIESLEGNEFKSIEKFNNACRVSVFRFVDEWKDTLKRIGRWADYDNQYATLDNNYIESVWWVFKQLWEQELIYKDFRVTPYCPRCGTPLSNFEVNQGYKTAKDPSVFVKFKVTDESNTFFLVWTTTPWTLPANVALAVGEDVEYVKIEKEGEQLILAKKTLEQLHFFGKTSDVEEERSDGSTSDVEEKKLQTLKGKDLVGKTYKPLFSFIQPEKKAHYVVAGDFISTEDGTGIVHIAPAFGEDDMRMAREHDLPIIHTVTSEGKFIPEVTPWAGKFVKGADKDIIEHLQKEDNLFHDEKIEHEYPFCWRCDSPLLYMALDAWYVKVTDFKDELLANNQKIHWMPKHLKDGRFGKWLEGARDWAISRNRFWGAPIPVWECEKCDQQKVVGSIEELQKNRESTDLHDLHRPYIDQVELSCTCGGTMKRITEVFDCWFESGSMPYAQWHYPYENKKLVEKNYPADFIAEGLDQTRGWFYTLTVLAAALTRKDSGLGENQPAFKNVIVNGLILAEDGKKLSKKLRNYTPPEEVFDKYGVDALRYFLLASTPIGEDYRFADKSVQEALQKVLMILWNVVRFYGMYADSASTDKNSKKGKKQQVHILDKWIIARLHETVEEVTVKMDEYDLTRATRPLAEFINDLSTWYVRRSRDRFKSDDENDKKVAISTLREVLMTLSQVMAPSMPFMAERVYQAVGGAKESVHLADWPKAHIDLKDDRVVQDMVRVRKLVEMGLALRNEASVKIRQVLGEVRIANYKIQPEYAQLIADELNVKKVIEGSGKGEKWLVSRESDVEVWLNTEITDELRQEGLLREMVRTVNSLRREAGLTIKDRAHLYYETRDTYHKTVLKKFEKELLQSTLCDVLKEGASGEYAKKLMINEGEIMFSLQ